jgi:hypothetical protein
MEERKLDKLKAKKAALEAQIRQELGRERSRQYKLDTRRKILAGAAVLDEAESNPEMQRTLTKLLNRFLTKPQDRDLFELPSSVPEPSRIREDERRSPAEPFPVPGVAAASRQIEHH